MTFIKNNPLILASTVLWFFLTLGGCQGPAVTLTPETFARQSVWERGPTNVRATQIRALALNSDGSRLACGNADGSVDIWSVGKDKPDQTLTESQNPVKCIAYSPDDRFLAWATHGSATNSPGIVGLCVFDQRSGRVAKVRQEGDEYGVAMGFTRDSAHLVAVICSAGRHEGHLALYDPQTMDVRWQRKGFYTGHPKIFSAPDCLFIAAFQELFSNRAPADLASRPLTNEPDALSFDGHTAFYTATPRSNYFSERGPEIFIHDGGMNAIDLDGKNSAQFYRFEKMPRYQGLPLNYYTTGGSPSTPWILAQLISRDGIIESLVVINLVTHRYQAIPQGGYLALSDNRRVLATGGNYGIAVWSLPQ